MASGGPSHPGSRELVGIWFWPGRESLPPGSQIHHSLPGLHAYPPSRTSLRSAAGTHARVPPTAAEAQPPLLLPPSLLSLASRHKSPGLGPQTSCLCCQLHSLLQRLQNGCVLVNRGQCRNQAPAPAPGWRLPTCTGSPGPRTPSVLNSRSSPSPSRSVLLSPAQPHPEVSSSFVPLPHLQSFKSCRLT